MKIIIEKIKINIMKKLVSLLLLFAFPFITNAGNITTSSNLKGAAIVQNATLSLTKTVPIPACSSLVYVDKITNYISLYIDQLSTIYDAQKYKLTVSVTIDGSDQAGNPVNAITRSLIITHVPFTTEEYIDKHVIKVSDATTQYSVMNVTINTVTITTLTGGALTLTLKNNVIIEAQMEIDRSFKFPVLYVQYFNANSYNDLDGNNYVDEIELNWQMSCYAEGYELEWVHISDIGFDFTSSSSSSLLETLLNYNFSNNATRVTLGPQISYKLNHVFEKGYLLYRIRPYSYSVTGSGISATVDKTKIVYGDWNLASSGYISSIGSSNKLYINNTTVTGTKYSGGSIITGATLTIIPFNKEKNWQYSVSFAEDGKKKEVVSFFDGSLHNRQTVTRINSDNIAVVGETLYDHIGRPAIQVLPSPMVTLSAGGTPLKYYGNLNLVNPTTNYSYKDFDGDNTNDACTPAIIPPFSNTAGSSQYYSANNPTIADKSNPYIPNAEGYPVSQVEYTPDNTGRVKAHGGVGINHQIGSNHEVIMAYGKPNQIELDRLFGNEVGNESHYRKNVVIDPNGQISISYIDLSGKVIATSLAGTPPANLTALNSSTTTVSITADLLAKDFTGFSQVNKLENNGYSLTLVTKYAATYTGNHTFEYKIEIPQFKDDCMNSNICFDCVYDLEIDVIDDCGQRPTVTSGPTLPIKVKVSRVKNNGIPVYRVVCENTTVQENQNFVLNILKVGSYTISKKLSLSDNALNFYLKEYLKSENNHCLKTLAEFEAEETNGISIIDCYVTCDECKTAIGTREEWVSKNLGTEDEYDRALQECKDICDRHYSPCLSAYTTMLADVSPGGQYAEYIDLNTGKVGTVNFPLSVLNETGNVLPRPNGNSALYRSWKNPLAYINGQYQPKYFEETDVISKIYFTRIGGTGSQITMPQIDFSVYTNKSDGVKEYAYPQELSKVEDFISLWRQSWAQSLVTHHPEYCYYQKCLEFATKSDNTGESLDDYDGKLLSIQSMSSATLLGLDAMQLVLNNDPFFNGIGSQFLTQMQSEISNYKSTGHSIEDYASKAVIAPNDPSAFGNWWKTGSIEQQDKMWALALGYYLSIKQQFQLQYIETKVRICASSTPVCTVSPCGTNDCIGNKDFNPFLSGIIGLSPLDFTNFFSSNQPCSTKKWKYYSEKIRRFGFTKPSVNSKEQGDYQNYLRTGQCPMAASLQYLLDGIVKKDILSSQNLDLEPNFTQEMRDVITGSGAPFNQANFYLISKTSSGLSNFQININGQLCNLTLAPDFQESWSLVKAVTELQYIGMVGTNEYQFKAIAHIDHDNNVNTPWIRREFVGVTCFPITGCSFSVECHPTTFSNDIILFLKAFTASNLAGSSITLTNLSHPDLFQFITPEIMAYLGEGNITQISVIIDVALKSIMIQDNSSGEYITISFSSAFISGSVDLTEFKINSIDEFNCKQGSNDLKFIIDGIGGRSVTIQDCKMQPALECNTVNHRVKSDFEKLLTDYWSDNYANPQKGFNTNGYKLYNQPDYTVLLKSFVLPTEQAILTNFVQQSGTNNYIASIYDQLQTPVKLLCDIVIMPNSSASLATMRSVVEIKVDYSQQTNGKYYHFLITLKDAGSNPFIFNGYSTCFPLLDCDDCNKPPLFEMNTCYVLYQEYVNAINTHNIRFANQFTAMSEKDFLKFTPCNSQSSGYLTTIQQVKNFITQILLYDDVSIVNDFQSFLIIYPTDYEFKQGFMYMLYYNYNINSGPKTWAQLVADNEVDLMIQYVLSQNQLDPKISFEDWKINQSSVDTKSNCSKAYLDYFNAITIINVDRASKNLGQWTPISYETFVANNLCNCGKNYFDYTNSIIDSTQSGNGGLGMVVPNNYPVLPLEDYVLKFKCKIPCVAEKPPFTIDLKVPFNEEPCNLFLIAVAKFNAARKYAEYLQNLENNFRNGYRTKCMSAWEEFSMQYVNKEYHYTLYYYDQAGNLIRTVPPEGVKPLNILSFQDALEIDILKDRKNGTQKVKTDHQLITTYEYNSLNQLIRQSVPDHDKMDIWEMELPNGLPSSFYSTGLQFTTTTKGYLCGYVMVGGAKRGMLFTTDNGGTSWKPVNHLVGTDFSKIQMVDANVGWAIGKEGVVFKTTDAGVNWDLIPVSTGSLQTAWFTDLAFTTSDGLLIGKNSIIAQVNTSTNIVLQLPITTGIPSGADLVSVVRRGTNDYLIVSQENGVSKMYYSTTNSSLSPFNEYTFNLGSDANVALNKIQMFSSSLGFACGKNGRLLKTINSGVTWQEINPDFLGDFEDIFFFSGTAGVGLSENVLYKTFNGGATWQKVLDATNINCLGSNHGQTTVYAGAEDGKIWRLIYSNINGNANISALKVRPISTALNKPIIKLSIFPSLNSTITAYVKNGTQIDKYTNTNAYAPVNTSYVNDNWNYNGIVSTGSSNIIKTHNGNNNIVLFDNNTLEFNGFIFNDVSTFTVDENGMVYLALTTGTIQGWINENTLWSSITMPSGVTAKNIAFSYSQKSLLSTTNKIFNYNGTTWDDQSSNVNPDLLNDLAIESTNQIMVVGKNGAVWQKNTGVNEMVLEKRVTTQTLNTCLVNTTTAIAGGNNGALVNRFSGQPFYDSRFQGTEPINDISYHINGIGSFVLYVSKTNSFISAINSSLVINKFEIQGNYGLATVPNATNNVFIAGPEGLIYKYDENANTKELEEVLKVHPLAIYGLNFYNTAIGAICGESGILRTTNNGGLNWKRQNTNTTEDLKAAAWKDQTTLYTGGMNGTLLRFNFSPTQTLQVLPITGSLTANVNCLSFSSNKLYAGLSTGYLAYLDNANTVTLRAFMPSGLISEIRSIHFYTDDDAVVVGASTTTGSFSAATTWFTYASSALPVTTGSAIFAIDAKTIYVASSNGRIYKNLNYPSGTWITIDKENPCTTTFPTTNVMTVMSFVSRTRGFIAGNDGLAYKLFDESGLISTRFWYDRLGRLVLSQNTKQYNVQGCSKLYSYTLFDGLGRVNQVGELSNDVNAQGSPLSLYIDEQMDEELYLNWVKAGTRAQVTRSYYDAPMPGMPSIPLSNGTTFIQSNMRKRVSSTTFAQTPALVSGDLDPQSYDVASHYTYDVHGNVNILVQDYKKLANSDILLIDQQFKTLIYEYDLISGNVNNVAYQPGEADQYYHKYIYDADNRVIETRTSRDFVIWDKDARYEYYKHGPLMRTIIGDQQVQGVDFAYTLQGWLKGVNGISLLSGRDIGQDGANALTAKDVFGYTLTYFDDAVSGKQDYKPIDVIKNKELNTAFAFEGRLDGSQILGERNDLYNGNISAMVTTITSTTDLTSQITAQTSQSDLPQACAYTYDQLNRLLEQKAFTNYNSTTNTWDAGTSYNNHNRMKLSYDANGNIETLERWGAYTSGTSTKFDDLNYKYDNDVRGTTTKQNNKLYHVKDAITNTAAYLNDIEDQGSMPTTILNANYTYDAIGNLIADKSEEIAEIKWTVYGKISEIIRTSTSTKKGLKFEYDASGNRIAKYVTYLGNIERVTYYVRDASGNVMASYEQNNDISNLLFSFVCSDHNIHGCNRVGIDNNKTILAASSNSGLSITSLTSEYKRALNYKSYELINYIGNVLATITDRRIAISSNGNTTDYYQAVIQNSTDYYVFGMLMIGRTYSSSSYRYGYNGQEKSEEIHAYDFGARIYDSRLGRFQSLDPYSKEYPMFSNYSYAANSPMILTDKEGKFLGTLLGAVIGGVVSAVRGEDVWKGVVAGGIAGAVADLIILSGGTATPLLLVTAGTISGAVGSVADQMIVQGKSLDEVDVRQVALGSFIGGGLGYLGYKLAGPAAKVFTKIFRKTSSGKTPTIEIEMPTASKFGGISKGGGNLKTSGYANPGKLDEHLEKRLLQGYKFEDVNEMIQYGQEFFKREGDNIIQFTDLKGNIHRLDNLTQEYGILQPDGKIQSVFKVIPNAKTAYKDGITYLRIQIEKWGIIEE